MNQSPALDIYQAMNAAQLLDEKTNRQKEISAAIANIINTVPQIQALRAQCTMLGHTRDMGMGKTFDDKYTCAWCGQRYAMSYDAEAEHLKRISNNILDSIDSVGVAVWDQFTGGIKP